MSLFLRIISYVLDFFVGFYANKAWDWCKEKKNKNDTRFSYTKKKDDTVTIDAHIVSNDKKTLDSAVEFYSAISGAEMKKDD